VALACALGAAAGAAGCADDATPAGATRTELAVGVAANTLGYGSAVGRAQDMVRHAGVRLIREELSWRMVEPVRGERRWAKMDRLMVAAAHRRLRVLALLTGTPAWAARPGLGLPTRAAAYGAYVRDVVARYGPNGTFWRRHPTLSPTSAPVWFELWNEPYFARPVRSPLDAQRYAALARAGLDAGRAADPDARFLLEVDTSYAGDPAIADTWLDRLERAAPGLLAAADGVAAHPYSDRAAISVAEVSHLRSALERRRLELPIWITEVGWSTCTDRGKGCVSESVQASSLRTFLAAMARRDRADVAGVVVYDLHDLGRVAADREQHFGMLRMDGTRKPSWSVLRSYARRTHDIVRASKSPHVAPVGGR
jgi:polysaccharide biosynthesis protein PslG